MINKEYKSYRQLLIILRRRGVVIPKGSSGSKAMRILETENYYNVINGYKDLFLATPSKENTEESYKTGTTFNEIYALYCFDRELRETLNLTVIYEDGYYTLRYRDLDIVLAEKTLSDLFNSFQEEFLMLWDEYALEDDENLTEQAQQLKQNLKSLVLIS